MYKIDVSRFRSLNNKFNDFIVSCFRFCSEYNIQKHNDGFDIKDVYKVFEDNGEVAFIQIIKTSPMFRQELIDISEDINSIKADYGVQTLNYYDIISGVRDVSTYNCSTSLKVLFRRIYEETLDTKVFIRYSSEVDLKDFKFIFSSIQDEVAICPYCNSVHITTIYSKDHLLPKSKFPLLAIWLENLVISCQQCNEGLKNADILLPILHPYFNNISDYFNFKYIITEYNKFEIDVEVNTNKSVPEQLATTNYLELFKIKDRANADLSKSMFNYLKEIRKEVESDCINYGLKSFHQIKNALENKIKLKINHLNEYDTKKASRNTKLKLDLLTCILDNLSQQVDLIQFNTNVKIGTYIIKNKVHN